MADLNETIRQLEAKLAAARKTIGIQHDECNRYVNELVNTKAALKALYEWYDRDGSVGGAAQVFEDHRDVALRGDKP